MVRCVDASIAQSLQSSMNFYDTLVQMLTMFLVQEGPFIAHASSRDQIRYLFESGYRICFLLCKICLNLLRRDKFPTISSPSVSQTCRDIAHRCASVHHCTFVQVALYIVYLFSCYVRCTMYIVLVLHT